MDKGLPPPGVPIKHEARRAVPDGIVGEHQANTAVTKFEKSITYPI